MHAADFELDATNDVVISLALLAAVLLVGALYERSAGNRRDAALLAAFGLGTGFGAIAAVGFG